ncbi:Serine/threonine-protein phosphatase 2A activator 2 [Boothiomyces macroporosus]|uniref:Serine/threonine-protein phosphatase 2A activator n=1 Tax=Boothiomyces macroporosus TaxID=261099 RepID=A0AAD5UM43_9FUNG|nr:Serine/threonine-protein phosphatase 2A activator 2 [Boothiomyces macroporosus]
MISSSDNSHSRDAHTHNSDSCCSSTPRIPKREILTKSDLERFQTSETYEKYMGFITKLNEAVVDKPLDYSADKSDNITFLMELLDKLKAWVDEIPPADVGLSRFGNPSFRKWHDKLSEKHLELLTIVPEDYKTEVGTYLLASFGDYKRIDYGTGHEASFMCFLLCLQHLGLIKEEDYPALVLSVFWQYIMVMRKLTHAYWLEPAGSHGVWGLDDYHFLPFLFGSGQLSTHKYLRPKSIHDPEILEEFGEKYMYLSSIKHINSIKSATLRWHSPMLDDISGVKKWEKVNSGMFKMYKAEVLNKLPIMQHFLFGSIIQFKGSADGTEVEMEHVHAFGQEHPLCCSIRIPSSIAAVQGELRKPIPFD